MLTGLLKPWWSCTGGCYCQRRGSMNPSVEPPEQSPGESGVQLTVRCRYRGLNYRRHVGREVPPLTDTLSQLSGFDKASDDRCFLFGCSPTAQRDLLCGLVVTGLLRQTYYWRTTSDMQKGATESDTCDAELEEQPQKKNGHFLLEIGFSKREKVGIYIQIFTVNCLL